MPIHKRTFRKIKSVIRNRLELTRAVGRGKARNRINILKRKLKSSIQVSNKLEQGALTTKKFKKIRASYKKQKEIKRLIDSFEVDIRRSLRR